MVLAQEKHLIVLSDRTSDSGPKDCSLTQRQP